MIKTAIGGANVYAAHQLARSPFQSRRSSSVVNSCNRSLRGAAERRTLSINSSNSSDVPTRDPQVPSRARLSAASAELAFAVLASLAVAC
jgi:hypothetical protein